MLFVIIFIAPVPEPAYICGGCGNDEAGCSCICGWCGNVDCDGYECDPERLNEEDERDERPDPECYLCEDTGVETCGPDERPCPNCQPTVEELRAEHRFEAERQGDWI